MNKIKRISFLCSLVFFVSQFVCNALEKTALEVFGYQVKKQWLFDVMPVSSFADTLDDHVRFVFEKYKNEKASIAIFQKFLTLFGYSGDFSDPSKIVLNEAVRNNLKKMYHALDHDIPQFVEMLKKLGFASGDSNEQEEKLFEGGKSHDIVEQYKALMYMLLAQQDEKKEWGYFFTVGSNFFHYCFSAQTGSQFLELLKDRSNHSICRLLYSVLWWALSGTGWRYWQVQTLRQLKEEADKGKTIVYLAGGNDLYHMIKRGIYTITIIDPELPTQPKYYTHGWEWLLKGEDENNGIGDEIVFKLFEENKKITLKRTKFKSGDAFLAQLAEGEQVTIQKSITQWSVYEETIDASEIKFSPLPGSKFPVFQSTSCWKKAWKYLISFFRRPSGTITFDRRYLVQEDFTYDNNKEYLMSFNEIFYIALKDWGIDPEKIDGRIKIHNKQVSYVMTKQDLINISQTSKVDFNFIRLGSCVN